MSTGTLRGRHVVVCVGGGIAAYKACDLVREYRRRGAIVRVAMTGGAQEFVTALTMQSLSGNPVYTDTFDARQEEGFGHLHLARWADVYVVAPATADLLARLAAGLGNDALTTTLLAFRGPVLLAPAMNTAMWDNAQTQANLAHLLAQPRFRSVGPASGLLADGDMGQGRLAELPDIVAATEALAAKGPLAGKKVLITAGPTREFFDPVRFVSNPSTGKMGLAMADVARGLGAEVTVVLGPVPEAPRDRHEIVDVVSAEEMAAAVLARVEAVDWFVSSAAVSDYRPETVAKEKLKKHDGPETITFVRTPDILATASVKVHSNPRRPVLVGFAAETGDLAARAREKLARKRLDFVVANDVSAPGAGFAVDTNAVLLIGADGRQVEAKGSKREVAQQVWASLLEGRP